MRFEGEHCRRQAGVDSSRLQTGEQRAVAKMHAIEVAYGQDGGTGRCL
jgi:hypothetical protein